MRGHGRGEKGVSPRLASSRTGIAPTAQPADRRSGELDGGFERSVLFGLSRRVGRKRLECKYFYDARGSRLFEQICGLPEYDLCRNEMEILRQSAGRIAGELGRRCTLIEPGCGSAVKTRVLLRAMDRPAAYVPIDVSREQLGETGREVAREFPWIRVHPVCGDFAEMARHRDWPWAGGRPRAVFFPGSTIGNFGPRGRRVLMRWFRRLAGAGGAVIIGIDLRKDPAEMVRAYDDAAGVTAAFNLNILARANRELGATFDLERFVHKAVWNARRSRIEMHLVSLEDQSVLVGERAVHLRRGESIRTECSHKFGVGEFFQEARGARLAPVLVRMDCRGRFAVVVLRVCA